MATPVCPYIRQHLINGYPSVPIYQARLGYQGQLLGWGGAMCHIPIQQKNNPLANEIAILNIERMSH